MTNAAFLCVALLALAAAFIKVGTMFRRNRPPGQGILLVLLLTLAITCAALSDKVQYQEDLAFHDFGRVLANITTMVAAFSILTLLITLGMPADQARPKVYRRLAALAICVAGMIAGYVWASPLPETLGDFGGLYATRPGLLLYIGLYIVFFGVALAELLVRSIRYVRISKRRPFLRAGLALLGLGSVLGLVYLGEKAWYVITQATRLPAPFASSSQACSLLAPPECLFSVTFPVAAVVLAAVGATLPVWGPALITPFRYYRNRRKLRELEPLWTDVHDKFPQITLPEQEDARWNLGLRLYRRVIEIRDALLLLDPYMSPDVAAAAEDAATARGLQGDDLRATVEAAEIAAAIRTCDGNAPAVAPSAEQRPQPDESDVSRQVAWLAKVSRAYASPLVQEMVSA
jgi:hypothetical protein